MWITPGMESECHSSVEGCAIFRRGGQTATVDVRQTLGGRYKLLNELGSGGMAVVWRARDEVLGRPVAVKLLASRKAGDPQSRARIRDEARAAANLSHPNIAQVYDYGEADEGGVPRPYVVMELVNGPTLQQRLASGPLPPRTVFRICGEVAAALAAAHAEGLVHRDIKMANIMVTAAGAKVVDFGIAAAVGPVAPEEMLVGTPAYLAPERLTGDAVLAASDVYALGVLLYRLLADEPPWSVESTTQMLKAHVYVEPAPLPPTPGVPPAVAALIARCLRKNPAARPTASTVSSVLADAAEAFAEVRGEDAAATPADADSSAAPGKPGWAVAATNPGWQRPADGLGAEALVAGRAGRSGDERAAPAGRPAAGATRPATTEPAPRNAAPDRDARPGGSENGARTTEPGRDARPKAAERDARPKAVERSGAPAAGQPGRGATSGATTSPGQPDLRRGMRGMTGMPGMRRAGAVRLGKRKSLIAAGVATVTAAALTAWLLAGDREPADRGAATDPTTSPAPVVNGGLGTLPPSRATAPAATALPGAGPVDGNGPLPSDGPGNAGSPAVSRGTTQTSPGPSRSPSVPASPATTPPGKRLTSPGGAVYAVCERGKATLTGSEPAEGYTVERVEPGPALTPLIVFKGPKDRYRITVTCVAGTPTPVVLPL